MRFYAIAMRTHNERNAILCESMPQEKRIRDRDIEI